MIRGRTADVLIVTPYHKEARGVLERCMESVRAQSVAVDHMMVADGHAADWIDQWPVRHIRLDREHADAGNTPRAIGMTMGIAEDYAAIGLLDADNWFEPDHVEACLAAAAGGGADYVATLRRLVRTDGTAMPIEDEPIEAHVDTSCFLFLPGSYHLLPYWGMMPRPLAPICDRIFHALLRARGARGVDTGRVTVNFQVNYDNFYHALGEAAPAGTKPSPDMEAMRAWIAGLDAEALHLASSRTGLDLATLFPDSR